MIPPTTHRHALRASISSAVAVAVAVLLPAVTTAQTATETPTSDGFNLNSSGVELALGIDLPVQPLFIQSMETGLAIFLIGLLAVLLGAAAFLRNYAAGIMWGLAVLALILSGVLGIGLELFWAVIAATILLLIVGMVVRWMD